MEQHEQNRQYYFQKKAPQLTAAIRALLLHPKLRAVNIHDLDESRRIVNQMVQSDRLPKRNSIAPRWCGFCCVLYKSCSGGASQELTAHHFFQQISYRMSREEGLLLLQQAWDECDIASHLARRYKFLTKSLYLIQLILAWVVIAASQVTPDWLEQVGFNFKFAEVGFVLAILSGAAVSIEGIYRPKPKWQALRSGHLSLISLIWQYRARVGQFRLAPGIDPRNPELVLCKVLNDWAEDLMSRADLKSSSWGKSYRTSVFRHQQHSGQLTGEPALGLDQTPISMDDHYSPVQPEVYIQFRMLERKQWYQNRIPSYATHAIFYRLLILSCAIGCSILARFDIPVAVVIVTAFGSASTTWAEFIDAGSKVERYTHAVRSITNLLNWWKNLSEVEKASTENISRLIMDTELAITDEQASCSEAFTAPFFLSQIHEVLCTSTPYIAGQFDPLLLAVGAWHLLSPTAFAYSVPIAGVLQPVLLSSLWNVWLGRRG